MSKYKDQKKVRFEVLLPVEEFNKLQIRADRHAGGNKSALIRYALANCPAWKDLTLNEVKK